MPKIDKSAIALYLLHNALDKKEKSGSLTPEIFDKVFALAKAQGISGQGLATIILRKLKFSQTNKHE